MTTNRGAPACPRCGSANTAQLLWGLPQRPLPEAFYQGRIVLGGCSVGPWCRDWCCHDCGQEWGMEFAKSFEPTPAQVRNGQKRQSKLQRQEAARERQAVKRGTLEAVVRSDGWTWCPHCGIGFSTRYPYTWDGEKHLTCRTRIRLIHEDEQRPGGPVSSRPLASIRKSWWRLFR